MTRKMMEWRYSL